MSTKVRELKPSDFDDLITTFCSYFDEVAADPSFGLFLYRERPSMEDERKWFAEALKDIGEGNKVVMVAEVDSHVVASCEISRVRPKSPGDHRANLGLSVKKGFRGKGIGEALMRTSLEICKGKFEIIELAVLTNNHGARRLYEKLGFRIYGTRKYAMKRGGRYFDEDLMYLKL